MISTVGRVAYQFDLPSELSQIHNTFNVSQLQKSVMDDEAVVPLDDIQVDECLNYIKTSVVVWTER